MRGDFVAGQALGYRPLFEASWTNTAGVEGVPDVEAIAHPAVVLAGHPTALRAANAAFTAIRADGPIFGH